MLEEVEGLRAGRALEAVYASPSSLKAGKGLEELCLVRARS